MHNAALQHYTYKGLTSFSKSLGLDIIITPKGRPYLLELQHGFGRRGLISLFPKAQRQYRKQLAVLRQKLGKHLYLSRRVRRICRNKIVTYKYFPECQPSSFTYRKWGANVERWLLSLKSDFILAKPPCGTCGKGIRVFEREKFLRTAGSIKLGEAILLQEYIESRALLDDNGKPRVGCIRHIVIMHCDSERLGFIHLPSYWRVSPTPYLHRADKEALTANISRGAYAQAVLPSEAPVIHGLTEKVSSKLVSIALNLPQLKTGSSSVISLQDDD